MKNKRIGMIVVLAIMLNSLLITGCGKQGNRSSESTSKIQVETQSQTQTQTESAYSSEEQVSSSKEEEPEIPSQDPVVVPEIVDKGISKNDIVFVGDSRTVYMSRGGRLQFDLVDPAYVFATSGGELPDDTATINAQNAAYANKKCAVFWYGINDIQEDWNKENPLKIVSDYAKILDIYHSINPNSQIVVLSILSTSVNEVDYYDKQEANIQAVNAGLKDLVNIYGGRYIDITDLFTSDSDLAENDNIHFSKVWYETKFLPRVYGELITN